MTTQKPESFTYWLKLVAQIVIPRKGDWRDRYYMDSDESIHVLQGIFLTLIRLLVLVTFPVSVPILALIALYFDHRRNAALRKYRAGLRGLRRQGETNE